MQGHVKTMLEKCNELLIVGDAITDEDRIVYLLASLPESFNTLVTALESNPAVPEMEIVIERLMHKKRKHKDRGVLNESESNGALAGKHRTGSKGPKCYGCQRFGHIQRNCPKCIQFSAESNSLKYWKQFTKGRKGVKNEVTHTRENVTHTRENGRDSEQNVIGVVTCHVLSAVETNEADSWIIDSGATCHICNNRQSFVNFHTLEKPQEVTLGDRHALSATGTGNVTLKTVLDNGKTKIYQPHDVLHVPKLAYNLLSVSKTTEAGKIVKFTKLLLLESRKEIFIT